MLDSADNPPIPLDEKTLFPLGRQMATPNALKQLSGNEIFAALNLHANGDWGDVDEHDRKANDRALADGSRLFSVYHSKSAVKFWIITEADRSQTTVLLPEDY